MLQLPDMDRSKDIEMIIKEFDIKICKENVLKLIDCHKDSPIYEEVTEEYEEMLPAVYEKMEPVALLAFESVEEFQIEGAGNESKEALFCITSIGGRISQWITELFTAGDYLGGMLADAMADDYLFQVDHLLSEVVIRLCREKKRGVMRRLEAPQDISMEVQKKALEVTDGENLAGIRIKESYMYDPVKTTCQVYLLDDQIERFHIKHDCSQCPNLSCKLRDIPEVTVKAAGVQGGIIEITGRKDQTLMEMLTEHGIFLSAVCAGRGTCGKCRIQVLEGEIEPSKEDKRFFSTSEISQGFRLACRAYAKGDVVITLDCAQEKEFAVLTDFGGRSKDSAVPDTKSIEKGNHTYGIAVDIGTTTIAMQLIYLADAQVVETFTAMNRQRAYGADVISRIDASNNGKREALKESIQKDLMTGISKLTAHGKLGIERMIIGANTTMVHLLMGYSCETLGVFPFTPVNLEIIKTTVKELLGTYAQDLEEDFEVCIYPGISTYVGGDITAGLYALDFEKREKPSVLIDLGTNGEMAVGNQDRIYVTSTAAGPAFEGGNITCGTGSIPGAVCKAVIEEGKAELKTILDQPVSGICGTGVVEIAYELLKEELMDETGLLEEDYFEDGYRLAMDASGREIGFYQKDIRELQLAKSAVRSGLETLILRYGITYEDIGAVYIAGGFGHQLDIRKAVGIGLLPKECEGKIQAVGNSCLKGAVAGLMNEDAEEAIESIRSVSQEIRLSNDKDFNEFYMDYMFFEEV
ncbi:MULTISPECIES: ASKHA domain-containing protein [Faecalicatena]|uniref:ASKHA domain-containing protein n=1 Tax=Faecalicatena TaxID=2005359 RepID=UPI001C0E591D|nr:MULTISPECIES: ASKHA domain-containing protein [Faecalicatena]MCI6468275.1 ASKHA domain-containing protein [Faecalicatena sp.]MDY5620529.1 ASKHA domain-containing protein [Lachnospiraceae bacterium]